LSGPLRGNFKSLAEYAFAILLPLRTITSQSPGALTVCIEVSSTVTASSFCAAALMPGSA
jgi:hypothetical protein